jgi:hypothetical protein
MANHSPKSSKVDSRFFEVEPANLRSLRLIAAPNPKDDLSDQELEALTKDPRYSPEIIRNLIKFVKSL